MYDRAPAFSRCLTFCICGKPSRNFGKLQGSGVGLLDGNSDFLRVTGDWDSVLYKIAPSGVRIDGRDLQVLFGLKGSLDGIQVREIVGAFGSTEACSIRLSFKVT